MMNNQANENIESVRIKFKPKEIKVLFIGESAPIAGTFFYTGDSLCKYTQNAFAMVCPEFLSKTWQEFLIFFKDKGFYLDDVCLVPINGLDKKARRQYLHDNISSLADRLREYEPKVVIVMLKSIENEVLKAIQSSGIHGYEYFVTPFGGMGHQNKYKEELATILSQLKSRGFI